MSFCIDHGKSNGMGLSWLLVNCHYCAVVMSDVSPFHSSTLEMGRMSDFANWPKPNIWLSSPNECRIFGRTSVEASKVVFAGQNKD